MNWQSIISTIIVMLAAAWLARRIWRIVSSGSRDGEGHVSSCGTCNRNPDAVSASPLVTLGKKRK